MAKRTAGGWDMALVVIEAAPRCASFYVRAETCLNHVDVIARIVGTDVNLSLHFEHSDAKWEGTGARLPGGWAF